jgi:hypothetical protein
MSDRPTPVSTLIEHHPYIWAWGTELGSFEGYMLAESEVAMIDKVPANAYRRSNWPNMTVTERERAQVAESEGHAVIVRDGDNGNVPVRVWRLFPGPTMPDVVRERVKRYARNLIAGRDVRA